jgi:hypothetical protein
MASSIAAARCPRLRDAGKLGLDDAIAAHLPWFRIGGSHQDVPRRRGGRRASAGAPTWGTAGAGAATGRRSSSGPPSGSASSR